MDEKGKVMVSLRCVATRGKTRGKGAPGRFKLKVGGRVLSHEFRSSSGKIDYIQVMLPSACGRGPHPFLASAASSSARS